LPWSEENSGRRPPHIIRKTIRPDSRQPARRFERLR